MHSSSANVCNAVLMVGVGSVGSAPYCMVGVGSVGGRYFQKQREHMHAHTERGRDREREREAYRETQREREAYRERDREIRKDRERLHNGNGPSLRRHDDDAQVVYVGNPKKAARKRAKKRQRERVETQRSERPRVKHRRIVIETARKSVNGQAHTPDALNAHVHSNHYARVHTTAYTHNNHTPTHTIHIHKHKHAATVLTTTKSHNNSGNVQVEQRVSCHVCQRDTDRKHRITQQRVEAYAAFFKTPITLPSDGTQLYICHKHYTNWFYYNRRRKRYLTNMH